VKLGRQRRRLGTPIMDLIEEAIALSGAPLRMRTSPTMSVPSHSGWACYITSRI
jgi:hypothetical protein